MESEVDEPHRGVRLATGGLGWGLGWLAVAALVVAMLGCVGPEQRGDRAMQQGNPYEALDHYRQVLDTDNQDPELFYKAAQAAQQQGAFGEAERYYSQALRYGGGPEIARSLAEFYIQTSNFAQAVEVFRYLVHIEEDDEAIQPLYSNLGTALMYSGQYLDAESYLLLAQQTDPDDPVPYVNLGVLYDRHLRNRPKAVMFYECFAEMSSDRSRVRTVESRLGELQRLRGIDTSRVNLSCGQPYRAAEPEHHDLREEFDLDFTDDGTDQPTDPLEIGHLELDVPLDYEPSADESDAEPAPREAGEEGAIEIFDDAAPVGDPVEATVVSEQFERAEEAFEAGRFDEAVDHLEQLLEDETDEDLELEAQFLLGESYYRVGRHQEAAKTLESAVEDQPRPPSVEILIEVYERLDEDEHQQQLCDRFAGWPDFEGALEKCD